MKKIQRVPKHRDDKFSRPFGSPGDEQFRREKE
jgi:hypothetical protein